MVTSNFNVIKYENIYCCADLCNYMSMGKASDALKQTLEQFGISQNQLAEAMEVPRPNMHRWFHGQVDPTAETVANLVDKLRSIDVSAADKFIHLYVGVSAQTGNQDLSIVAAQQLPESARVNIPALASLFGNTTNSYKYLFFLSLLDILRRRHFEVLSPISFQELIVEMLANAWFPHTFFKLSFGTQDQIAQKLDSLELVIDEPIIQFRDTDKKLLRQAIASQDLKDVLELSRYVPFRLIRPFLSPELQDVSLSKGNALERAMPEIADRFFEIHKPIYRFNATELKNCQSVLVHPHWASYFEKHYAIVRAWAAWEWLNYMQKRNPSTPSISSKLFMPSKRESLKRQTDYWKLVLSNSEDAITCIYSGEPIRTDKFSLDHYIPWSFVAHDQLWNLIPTLPEVNSSKSNHLPARKYFENFVKLQHVGLNITHTSCQASRKNWNKLIESFSSDLALSHESDLLCYDTLKEAYERTVQPLESLALTQGFSGDWSYIRV